jgi:DNA-binding response OmpR family regulator
MSLSSSCKFQSSGETGRFLHRGPITLDLQEQRILLKNKSIRLPPCTFDYMVTLISRSPEGVSYQQLVSASQGYQLPRLEAQDLARMRVYLLRKVIEENINDPVYILAVPGYGYRLNV